jgi:hypothetical protein
MVDEQTKQEVDMITKAHLAAERLEKANEINKELVKRMEAIEARRVLGGQSNAGTEEVKELSEKEKMEIGLKNYWKGSALEGVFK